MALLDDVLITNRHVLAGAELLEVNTYDGRTLEVETAAVGVLGDVGVARVSGTLPLTAKFGEPLAAGAVVNVVGYPRGGALTITKGTVVDRIEGDRFGVPGIVMRLTARVEPGNSGGPVLDRDGRLVGIVYALEIATGFALAIPIDTLDTLVDVGGFQDVPPCGED